MTVQKLKEIAARYDFIVAETEDEKRKLEHEGYSVMSFDENEIFALFALSKKRSTYCREIVKELIEKILDAFKGVDYFDFLFDGIQAIADDEYGVRVIKTGPDEFKFEE